MNEDELTGFLHAIRTLRPYLDQLVIVGGWAQQLYWRHELAAPLGFEPLRTQDVDLALPRGSQMLAREEPISVLLEGAGYAFFPKDVEERPPVAEYRRADDESGLSLEFLAPLIGASTRRSGREKVTEMILGISAQTLRHIDLLLEMPWEVELPEASQAKKSGEVIRIRVPNPVSYIIQKLLIHLDRRERAKRAKDVLYVHDTLLTFGHEAEKLSSLWRHHHSSLSSRQRQQVEDIRRHLSDGPQDIHRQALDIARGSGRVDIESAEHLCQVLEFGLSQVLD